MEESQRNVLRTFRMHIAKNMDAKKVVEALYSKRVLDKSDCERILSELTTEDKVFTFLDILPRKGPQAFGDFLQALNVYGYGFLARAIQSKLTGESVGEENVSKPSCFGLPNRIPKFFGRSEICEEITRLLDAGKTILITVVAPPGFGKTAVAKHMGHVMLEKGKDVLYLSLRTVTSVALAAKTLLEIIGMPVGDNPVMQVKRYLTSLEKETVLVLDNAEDLQIGEESVFNQFLEEIGQCAKNLVILITSRNPLSKVHFPFSTKHIPLKPLDEEPSFLFLKNNAPSISDQIARLFAKPKVCGGIPMLLEITASFLESKTIIPHELHRKLQNCPHSFLKAKHPNIRELYFLLKVFYDHLQPEVKKALSSLAAFPTVFTKEEAKKVLFPNEDYFNFQLLLEVLESHSLLQQDEVDNCLQYSLHPLVQAFCIASREDACKGYNMAIKLFTSHYLALLRQLNKDFISTDCKIAIDKYEANKTNICHALSASTEDALLKHNACGLNISTKTVNFLAKVMNMDEFMSFYNKFLNVAKALSDQTLYSECLVSIGFKQLCYYGYKDAYRTEAKRNLQEAHDLQNHLGIYDTECHGHCKCKLGLCTFVSGDRKKGISLIAQGIGLRKKLEGSDDSGKMERMLVAGGFSDLAMAMFTSGKYKAAANIWENICLVKYRELLGTHPFTASLLDYIGKAYHKLDDPQRAVVFKERCLTMRQLLLGDDHLDTARAYYGLGCALGGIDSTDRAVANLNKAHNIQERFHASEQDIKKTEQELNHLRGCQMLEQIHIETL